MHRIALLGVCALLAISALRAQDSQPDSIDSLFDGPEPAQIAEAKTIDNPEAALLEGKGLVWGGELIADFGIELPYGALPPGTLAEWRGQSDKASVDLGATLHFDSRPDRNFRVHGSFETSYPFTTSLKTLADPAMAYDRFTNPVTSVSQARLDIFELFADFNWDERLFFRFGKQTAGWGLSRFYQVGDPLSVGIKDPQDPSKELEGPVALKLSLPFGSSGLYAYAIAKDSYSRAGETPRAEDLGYGIRGDFFLSIPRNPVIGDAELSAGCFYQRRLAPKAVFGMTTSLWDFQIFSDQVLAYGSDGYRIDSGLETIATALGPMTVYAVSKDDSSIFYSATAGAMYMNKDLNLTLYGEYFYNGQGSGDPAYVKKLGDRYAAEALRTDAQNAVIAQSDLFAYNARHNSAFSASLSELLGSDKLSCALFWQANWVDLSGMIVPSLSFAPWKHFSLSIGSRFVYGPSDSEFILKNSDFSTGAPRATRFAPYLKVYFGAGKF